MGRIEKKFKDLKEKGEKALIFYLTGGDPSLATTGKIIQCLDRAGLDIIEIGVPFSDPTSDGPIIQAASRRALQKHTSLSDILALIEKVREVSEIPIVLFGYYNPIFNYGNKSFAQRAKEAGVDGIIVVDLPFEEAGELRQYTDSQAIDFISLIAPTTGDERIRKISGDAGGFLYYISITGVTGTGKPRVADIKSEMTRINKITSLPVVVGFGISTPPQAAQISPYTDGIVIGSAFVRLIQEKSDKKDLLSNISSFASDFKRKILRVGSP